MKMSPSRLKTVLNFYPPYLGAGIKVAYITEDFREMRVNLKVRWYNRNYFGTHFGGSLFAMTDPHFVLLLAQIMGRDYIIWDKSGDIEFIKATKRPVSATFRITDEMLEGIRNQTDAGNKYLPQYTVDIIDDEGTLIAQVKKTIYVRRKMQIDSKAP